MSINNPIPSESRELHVEVMGHQLRVHTTEDADAMKRAVELLEQSFRDMECAYGLKWGCSPSALDTTTWMLMGSLNLAHRLVVQELETSRHKKELEQKLTKLLDEVPEDILAPASL